MQGQIQTVVIVVHGKWNMRQLDTKLVLLMKVESHTRVKGIIIRAKTKAKTYWYGVTEPESGIQAGAGRGKRDGTDAGALSWDLHCNILLATARHGGDYVGYMWSAHAIFYFGMVFWKEYRLVLIVTSSTPSSFTCFFSVSRKLTVCTWNDLRQGEFRQKVGNQEEEQGSMYRLFYAHTISTSAGRCSH